MTNYKSKSFEELNKLSLDLMKDFEILKSKGYKLDMSRGKMNSTQLSLSNGLISSLSCDDYISETGIDTRNYGCLEGLPEIRHFFSEILEIPAEQIVICGNSSLNLMFDSLSSAMSTGVNGGKPFALQEKVKFLCPVPGYDRHFSMCEHFNIEMIAIPLNENGPDMDLVEKLVSSDSSIKGIWCTPKYSNPDGVVYSDETVRRFANLKPAAKDFRIYWDNAYVLHDLYEETVPLLNIIDECEKAGNPDLPIVFASFSKVTFAGSSISCIASSKLNVSYILKRMSYQTVGHEKLNQLRHFRFFKNVENIKKHMQLQANLLRPKFELVINILNKELSDLDICTYTNPRGGYFISFYAMEGCAKKIVDYCKECGVIFTSAGATYPYGVDKSDRHIRIAPTFPSQEELNDAINVFCISVKLATVENLLNSHKTI